jgi:cytochrome c-type biogenesis protein CcmE
MAKKGSTRWILGGVVIAAAVTAISFLQLDDNLIYFYTPSEAHAKAVEIEGQTVKVGGMVKAGTVVWKPETLSLTFVMGDLEGHDITVRHNGTPPDMFKEGQGVVVEGRLAAGGKEMTSRNLMVKHSEEYKKPGDHASMDKALLEKSLFKDAKP